MGFVLGFLCLPVLSLSASGNGSWVEASVNDVRERFHDSGVQSLGLRICDFDDGSAKQKLPK